MQFAIGSGDVTLAVTELHTEHDLIHLRRQVRWAAGKLGFSAHDLGRLSTAVYEAGLGLFLDLGPARAEVRLADADGPVLRVLMHARVGEAQRGAACERLASATQALVPLVDNLAAEVTEDGVGVWLACCSPAEPSAEAVTAASHQADGDGVRTDRRQLQRQVRELRDELQETNRGVIALYTELEEQAERLRQAEDRLRVLLDGVHDYAICMLGQDGEIATWNAGAERLFGYAAGEIIGRSVASFYTAADRDEGRPAQHIAVARDAGRHEIEGVRVRCGGSTFEAHVLITAVRRRTGELRGFSLVVRDVTERKRLEDDLRRRAEDLAAANRAKEDFLATLSHELRTPLNAMLGWTRLLRSGRLDEAGMEKALDTIERNAYLQAQLIADILDVSRIVTGKIRMELRPIELRQIVEGAIDSVRPTAQAKGIDLRTSIAFSDSVLGDPDRLQQVVWNLLSNAIKFTPQGGRVSVSLDRAGADAALKVTDTGEGIPPEFLPYVFDRFRQGDGSVTRPHGGLGLGLSIVRHIIELHGGAVAATSPGPNEGSTFEVRVPVRAVQNIEAAERPVPRTLAGLRVLVVDDDADAREVVSLALAQCGAKTCAVGSTRAALSAIETFHPDVVVSDLAMPGEDGYVLLRKIRQLATPAAGMPVVALTASGEADDRRRAMEAGFGHFVPKPVDVEELAAIVGSVSGPAR
ncbi:MAG TPA: ATP-binding protein [Vicinamibacterales bacterium]|nr:ATP-binding protein [Vicinamibacterales bacterium]